MVTGISARGIIFHAAYTCGVCHTVEGVKTMQAAQEGLVLRFESNVV